MGADQWTDRAIIRQLTSVLSFFSIIVNLMSTLSESSNSDSVTSWYTQDTLNKKNDDRIFVFTEGWVSKDLKRTRIQSHEKTRVHWKSFHYQWLFFL
jgi:hypothetical protein